MNPKFYVVGGAVRDVLLGQTPTDIDYVVVGATPEWMIKQGYTVVGADFPVFLHPFTGDEYALARTERKTGAGYHGFVCHADETVTLEDDLVRRDLTINSLAVAVDDWKQFQSLVAAGDIEAATSLVVGNTADIRNRTIRANSGAFEEDPVRVFRAFRFMATLAESENIIDMWQMDPKTAAACRRMIASDDFKALTRERVAQEVIKAGAKSKSMDQFFRFMFTLDNYGALSTVIPSHYDLFAFSTNREGPVSVNDVVAVLMLAYDPDNLDAAANELGNLRYPSNSIRFAKTVAKILNSLDPIEASMGETPTGDEIADLFDKLSMGDAAAAITWLEAVGAIKPNVAADLQHCVGIWNNVRAKDLTEDQLETLTGPRIGMAIRWLKHAKINNYLASRGTPGK